MLLDSCYDVPLECKLADCFPKVSFNFRLVVPFAVSTISSLRFNKVCLKLKVRIPINPFYLFRCSIYVSILIIWFHCHCVFHVKYYICSLYFLHV